MDALAALRFAAAGLHGAGIFGAAMLYALVALDLAEPLLSGAELGGAGILDATVLYMLVAFLPRAESWTLLCSTCWLPWTSRSCCLPSRSSAAQASWTLPCSTCWSPFCLVEPLLAAVMLDGAGISGAAVHYTLIILDLTELLLAVTGLTGPGV